MQNTLASNRIVYLFLAAILLLIHVPTAFCQSPAIFYSQNFSGMNGVGGQVGKYDPSTSTTNAAFVLQSNPSGVSASAGNLFVNTYGGGRGGSVGEYSEATGGVGTGTINTGALITGLTDPVGILSVGTNLFVSSYVTPAGGTASQSISAYSVTNGVATSLNNTLITGLSGPSYQQVLFHNTLIITDPYNNPTGQSQGTVDAYTLNNVGTAQETATPAYSFAYGFATGLALYGNNLFVSNPDGNVAEYDARTGAVINSMFLTGMGNSYSLAISGNYLYVATYSNSNNGTITRFDLTSPAVASTATVEVANAFETFSITADNPVPEPCTLSTLR